MGVRRYGFGPNQPRFAILGTQIPCWGTLLCLYELTFNPKIENNFKIFSLKKNILSWKIGEHWATCFFAYTVELYFRAKISTLNGHQLYLIKLIFFNKIECVKTVLVYMTEFFFLSQFEFGHNLSFWFLSQLLFLSFVTISVFEFCHHLIFLG